jgi:hypothetical protein
VTESSLHSELRRFLELLYEPGDVFEVRAPKCRERRGSSYTSTVCGYYTFEAIDRAADAIADLDTAGLTPGIYATLNPVRPDLLARAANRLRNRAVQTTSDRDISRRRWLLIDVDPARPSGVSATESELALAGERATAVREHLSAQGWPDPIRAMSGNGHHLLYRIDLPADDDGLARRILDALAVMFSDDAVSVDRSVFNPARIVKVIGTVARKGDDLRDIPGIEDRPHRRSHLLDVPTTMATVAEAQLEAVAAPVGPTDATRADVADHADGERFPSTPDGVRAWLEARGVVVKGQRPNGTKTMLLLDRCPVNPEIVSTGGSDIAVLVGDDGKLAYCNKHSRGQDFTWHDLRRAVDPEYAARLTVDHGVDLSGLLGSIGVVTEPEHAAPGELRSDDPGPIPEDLMRVPGFVAEIMDFTLANAPYPNVGLAFCGAMALQSFLAGRKVRTPGDLRPNIYLLALASSGTGKDFPRKVNSRVLFEVGLISALGDKFASGEGIQDALVRTNAMLFQNDEMDGVLRQINLDRENRRESIPNILLTLYTSANDVYPIRVKAGQKEAVHIDQPHLTLFGTATPQYFYESLSQRMLTNGFFARMMIVDIGRRGKGQTPGSARDVPDSIIEKAQWWADYQPGQQRGNLFTVHPEPRIVEFDREANDCISELQRAAEIEYDQAEETGDEVARTAWSRACENAKKLALIYACSVDRENPVITLPAVEWAIAFATHQTRRQLHLAATYVAENPFHAECLKLQRKLAEAGGQMARRQLMRAMRCKAADFDQIVSTLIQQGDIAPVEIPTRTKAAGGYQLV